MKRLPRLFPLLLVLPLAVACAPARGPVVISLSVDEGEIVVDPDSATATRSQIVRWTSADENAVWLVVFADATPMRNGRRVFHGGSGPGQPPRGPVAQDAETTAYKYWVFYPAGDGEYLQVDPELWIIDDEN